jgi:Ca2+-binding RTX toxin-like protein
MTTSFTVNKADLEFILKQIKIAEDTSVGYTPLTAPKTILQSIMDTYGLSAADAAIAPFGLRTVDGSFNSLLAGQSLFGAADTIFPRLTDPVYRNDTDGDSIDLNGPAPGGTLVQGNYGLNGNVVDADPRIISNLIVDMSVNNPAAITTFLSNPLSVAAFEEDVGFPPTLAWFTDPANTAAANEWLQTIPNQSPDIGLSPGFNSWMTFFGQFFDHGLDLVTKGGNGTVYIPLQPDDPLIAGADGILVDDPGTAVNEAADNLPAHLQFMALTRATPTTVNGVTGQENTTTSFVDQNQTYTSHPSHQVFLREYVLNAAGDAVSTGKLLDGTTASGSVNGAIGNWGEVKAQALTMLGIRLVDHDVHNVPLLLTDQYGKFIPGPNGYAQMVMAPDATHATNWLKEGTAAGITTAGSISTGHAFLDDIAHHAAPRFVDTNHNGIKDAGEVDQVADADPGVGDDGLANTYDDEMLNAHFVTGDGRGNENIALTTVHSIFHSEHNRLVDANKATIIETGDLAFINEWLLVDVATVPASPAGLVWDGERLFQAARFTTEMQYQHMVFEEFARRIQPMIDPFIFNNSPEVDPSILAEFAHTVYRFGHSMLTGTVDRLDNNLDLLNGDLDQQTLLAVFLNPQAYIGSGADLEEINANLIRGLSLDVGNAIDEFIVTDLRSNLLGLPLDLAVLNLARGRETGIPSLNETRAQLYNDTGLADLKPYESWFDFAQNIKNAASIINFIAAYGTHSSITSVSTLAEKRAAAEELVFGIDGPDAGTGVAADRLDFLNARNAYAGDKGGLNLVDLWIGGLAEKSPEFGGMLGVTFNYVFEAQMENLQFGDRLYYLSRTQGTNFLNQLEPNTFADIVMRNTALGDIYSTHINGSLFVTPDHIIELDRGIAQADYNGAAAGNDPLWDGSNPVQEAILGPKVVRDYTGASTVMVGSVQHDVGGYLRVLGGEHYVLGGTEGNDRMYGDSGIDALWGDGGDDYLNGMTESDDVFGGEGNDVIEDPFGDDVLRGNQGDDVITSARGFDLVFGDQGQDYIVLGQDASEVFGGTGTDFILGGMGADAILGNEGDDWIEGGGGFDGIAGENSELFFNSPIIGHDILFGHGDETDYDAESGDDIMGSGPSVYRYEGMFGFDWGIAKYDIAGVQFDLQIPIFTTIPADVLRDRFDQVEALSGWKYSDTLEGDDRGHQSGGSSAPDAVPTQLFTDHLLTQEGINRIAGLERLMGDAIGVGGNAGARQTLFGGASPVPGSEPVSTFRDGNILLGGDGGDFLRGRGGYDILDGDAWLNVRIKIVIPTGPNAGTYAADSMTTDTTVMGQYAGKVFNINADGSPNYASVAFGGRSLTSLMLDRTISPGNMSVVREILNSDGSQVALVGSRNDANDIDTAIFHGTKAEYDIEGEGTIVAGVVQRAFDLNGDGFISVRDRDTGAVGATVNGVTLTSRGALTDDTDLLKNIERLAFSDQTIAIGGNNAFPTGVVTIGDPTPFGGLVTPYVGQVLVPTLTGISASEAPLDPSTGLPVGLTFEWQSAPFGDNAGWTTIQTSQTYTVRSVDPGNALRAVAVFKDTFGVTERIYSASTDNPTAPFSVSENALSGTIVGLQIPINADSPADADPATVFHQIDPANNAGGRFKVIRNGVDVNNFPRFSLVVDQGGPTLLDYEAVQSPVDNQYQVVVNTYSTDPALGGVLIEARQFTILLNDVVTEGTPTATPSDIGWNGVRPAESALPGTGVVIANLSTVDLDGGSHTYTNVGGDPAFTVTSGGAVSRGSGGLASNTTYVLNVRSTDSGGLFTNEVFNIRTGTDAGNTISGSGLTDVVYGDDGDDRLVGLGGDDVLFGMDEQDVLDGGEGNDQLTGGDDDDVIFGGGGNDIIRWTWGDNDDDVDGGADFDTLVLGGTTGGETLLVTFDGATLTQFGDSGTGTIVNVESVTADMLGGTDTLDYQGSAAGVTVDLTLGTASGFTSIANIENVTGGNGNDNLIGRAGQTNTLVGDSGDDTFTVHDTADVVQEFGGDGTDLVQALLTTAGATYTITDGDVENLTLLGTANINGTGNASANVITGNSGSNTLNGLGGTDTVSYANAATGVVISLAIATAQDVDGIAGGEADTLLNFENLTGSNQADTLTGNTAANVLAGGGANDTLVATVDNLRDTLDGGAGTDTANYSAYATGLTVNLGGAAPILVGGSGTTAANSDVVVSIENFIGGSGGDALTGNGGVNVLSGGGGGDVLAGDGGNDTLSGDAGNDTLTGGAGTDTLNGGADSDTINYTIGDGADVVDGGSGTDTLNILGTAGNDTLDVSWNGSVLSPIEGGAVTGVEAVNANLGAGTGDALDYSGSTVGVSVNLGAGTATGFASLTSVENVVGTAQVDVLTGSAAANTLTGGGGADTLDGGAAGDLLIGGAGADVINTGAADDDAQDTIRFDNTTEFGDTVSNFDATGTAAQIDRVVFGGALNTAYDDGNSNDNFLFATGDSAAAGTTTVTVGQGNGDAEGLLLNNGVTTANLGVAASVAAAFNAEFAITASNGEDGLLVVDASDGNNFALWQWIQAGGGETDASELSLIGIFQSNASVTAAHLDFV